MVIANCHLARSKASKSVHPLPSCCPHYNDLPHIRSVIYFTSQQFVINQKKPPRQERCVLARRAHAAATAVCAWFHSIFLLPFIRRFFSPFARILLPCIQHLVYPLPECFCHAFNISFHHCSSPFPFTKRSMSPLLMPVAFHLTVHFSFSSSQVAVHSTFHSTGLAVQANR